MRDQNNKTELTQQRREPLRTRRARRTLAKAISALFDHWELTATERASLLGLSPDSRSAVARYRRGAPLPDRTDLLKRVGHLLAIHRSLRVLFPYNRDIAYRWVKLPNARFGGCSALDVMRHEGFLGVVAVRHHLDFERAR